MHVYFDFVYLRLAGGFPSNCEQLYLFLSAQERGLWKHPTLNMPQPLTAGVAILTSSQQVPCTCLRAVGCPAWVQEC